MRTLHAPVQLSTGRTVIHSRMENGAQAADIAGEHPEMTEAEYEEYCALIRKETQQPPSLTAGR